MDGQDSVHPDLLVGHPVDDAVVARVHVPQVVSDGDDGQGQSDHQPQDDVEDHGVVEVVLVGQVVRAARVALQQDIYRFVKRGTIHPSSHYLRLHSRLVLPSIQSLTCSFSINVHVWRPQGVVPQKEGNI